MAINFFKKGQHHPDYFILATVIILTVFGLVMLASASLELGRVKFNDTYYYLKHQIFYGLSVGIFGFLLTSRMYYRVYQKFALPLLLISLTALGLVFTSLGHVASGAGRWLKLGSFIFQPAEILKITFIIYLAAWLANTRRGRSKSFLEGFMPFLIIISLVGGMLIMQPATSTVVILIGAGLVIYFVSGASIKYIALTGLMGAIILGIIIYATPYRLNRVLTFLNIKEDTSDASYHINEALITFGSGGLLGNGYGQSTSKVNRLPASINDSIFAVIGGELGFVGAGSLAILFAMLTARILLIARKFDENFGRFILVGFGTIIGAQALINMGAITGLLPLTGVPLPFISYGGTALAIFLTMSGIVINISKYS